ncbi:MAG: hypothetical protein V4451_19315 [Pseudomonadota bacterium]
MKRVAARIILASLATTFVVPFFGFALNSLLASPEDGIGVQLGMFLLFAAMLAASYFAGVIGTALLVYALLTSEGRATPMDRYWVGLGSAYSILGCMILVGVIA